MGNENGIRKRGRKNKSSNPRDSNNEDSKDSNDSTAKWPLTLEKFVSDSFVRSNGLSDGDKRVFQEQIRFLLDKAERENKLFANDWAQQKIPVFDLVPLELHCNKGSRFVDLDASTLVSLPEKSIESPLPEKSRRKGKEVSKDNVTNVNPKSTKHVNPKSTKPHEIPKGSNHHEDPHAVNSKEPRGAKNKDSLHPKEPPGVNVYANPRRNSNTSPQTHTSPQLSGKFDSNDRKRQRLERFNSPSPEPQKHLPKTKKNGVLIGRCQNLEKRYYRLTSEPDPNLVRPKIVLTMAVERLINLENHKPYSYIKDQFKAIRQDLTVQHIKDDFTVFVYSLNARIAIKNNDLGEMNQCVTQLEYLFALNGSLSLQLEFMCYRILYMLMVGNHSEILKIKYKIKDFECRTDLEQENFQLVTYAFQLQDLMIKSDYFNFFKIVEKFKPFDLMYKLVQDYLVEKETIKTLNILAKSYRKLLIGFLCEIFDIEEESMVKFLQHFALECGLEIDCTVLKPQIYGLMSRTNFKKIDIKGQV